jgi:hypothetical protein
MAKASAFQLSDLAVRLWNFLWQYKAFRVFMIWISYCRNEFSEGARVR